MAELIANDLAATILCANNELTITETLDSVSKDALKEAIISIKHQIDNRFDSFEALKNDKDILSKKFEETQNENVKLKNMLESMQLTINIMQQEISQLKEDNFKTRLELNNKTAELEKQIGNSKSRSKTQKRTKGQKFKPNRDLSDSMDSTIETDDSEAKANSVSYSVNTLSKSNSVNLIPGIIMQSAEPVNNNSSIEMHNIDENLVNPMTNLGSTGCLADSKSLSNQQIKAGISHNKVTNQQITAGNSSSRISNQNTYGPKTFGNTPTHCPPIKLSNFGKWSTLSADLKKITKDKIIAMSSGPDMKIIANTSDDYRAIADFLKEKNIPHVVFDLEKEKLIRVVIKRMLDEVDLEEIKEELSQQNIEVRNILRMNKSKENTGCSLILVTLQNIEENKRIFNIHELAGLSIQIAPYVKQQRIFQCYNCQAFGHGASSCHLPPKCVRCGQGHESRTCNRPRDVPARCANCKGAHPSSFRNCPSRPKLPLSTAYSSAPLLNNQNFPSLPQVNKTIPTPPTNGAYVRKNVSYSQAAASTNPSNDQQMMSTLTTMLKSMSDNHNMMMKSLNQIFQLNNGQNSRY